MRAEAGQAQIEALAAVLAIAFVAGLGLKAAAFINATLVADAAVHAGALAQAGGGDGERAARRALPAGQRERSRVRARNGVVSVEIPAAGGKPKATVGSRAWSRAPSR